MKFKEFNNLSLSTLRVYDTMGYVIQNEDEHSIDEILNAEVLEFRAISSTAISVTLDLE